MTKKCTKCLKIKDFSEFHKQKSRYNSHCKVCRKAYFKIKNKIHYDKNREEITRKALLRHQSNPEERLGKWLKRYWPGTTNTAALSNYKRLFEAQSGLCKICRKNKKLVVDHCHKTGRVRGLLCSQCNAGLGFMRDDLEILKMSIEYLKSA